MFTPATRAAVVLILGVVLAAPRRSDAAPATPLPGTVGLVQKQVPLRNACAATFREIKKVRGGDEKKLALALQVKRLTGLDFAVDDRDRFRASRKRMDAWMDNLMERFFSARKVQENIVVDETATPKAKVEALARMVILIDQSVLLLRSIEVPVSDRNWPGAATRFCDRMSDLAEPSADKGEEIRAICARTIAEHQVGEGWWTTVCMPLTDP